MEFASPRELFSNSHSHFTSLVNQTGFAEAEHLQRLANKTISGTNQRQETTTLDGKLGFDGDEIDVFLSSNSTDNEI